MAPPPLPPRRARAERLVLAGLGLALAGSLAGAGRQAFEPRSAPERARHAVDLATAEPWQLTLLPGIGASRAHALVSVRTRDDGAALRTWEDVLAVPGIGPGIVRRLETDRPVRVLLRGRPLRWAREPRRPHPVRRP